MVDVSAVALNGLRANEQRLAVAANNIANLDTTGYKAQQLQQSSQVEGGVTTQVVDRNPPTVTVAGENGPEEKPNVSLEQELVESKIAVYNFKANLKVLKAQDELRKSLLDIQA